MLKNTWRLRNFVKKQYATTDSLCLTKILKEEQSAIQEMNFAHDRQPVRYDQFDHFFSFKIVWDFSGYFGSTKEWVSRKFNLGTLSAIIF